MSYRDLVFQLPEPTFLFVYDMVVWRDSVAAVTSDNEGRQTTNPASVAAKGYIASRGRREREDDGNFAVLSSAVALLPHGVPVGEADRIEALTGPSWLLGAWKVTEVNPNPSHLRCSLERPDNGAGR